MDIGQRYGFSESGASRRVSRALDKLRTLLSRQGVTTSSAGLAAVLMANAANAAPLALSNALAAASLSAVSAATTATGILTLMSSLKIKVCLATLLGAALITPVVLIRNHSASRQIAAEESKTLEMEHLREAGDHLRALITFAGDHGGTLPQSLEEIGLLNDHFEFVAKGVSLAGLSQPERQVLLKQRQAWQTPEGPWKQVYGYADGHSQAQTVATGHN